MWIAVNALNCKTFHLERRKIAKFFSSISSLLEQRNEIVQKQNVSDDQESDRQKQCDQTVRVVLRWKQNSKIIFLEKRN